MVVRLIFVIYLLRTFVFILLFQLHLGKVDSFFLQLVKRWHLPWGAFEAIAHECRYSLLLYLFVLKSNLLFQLRSFPDLLQLLDAIWISLLYLPQLINWNLCDVLELIPHRVIIDCMHLYHFILTLSRFSQFILQLLFLLIPYNILNFVFFFF